MNANPPIAEYAVIGDCRTAALISRDGSIEWYCPGRFDAPAVFCRLLDAQRGGYLRLGLTDGGTVERRYRDGTNVLETLVATVDGRARITDFMPLHEPGAASQRVKLDATSQSDRFGVTSRILRLVEGLAGTVELELALKATFDYGRADTALSALPAGGAVARAGRQRLTLDSPGIALRLDDDAALRGRVRVASGERLWIILTVDEGQDPYPPPRDGDARLAATTAGWRAWTERITYRGPYLPQVQRSALTLKLLTHEPTGAIVAAPTTSLPEQVGGQRNWDYRFTWLRDSSLILYALMTVGCRNEAHDFIRWLERTIGADPSDDLQIMYGVDGRRELDEQVLDHLAGYRGSRPVRIGNAAAQQRQTDIFGEILNAAHVYYRHGRGHRATEQPDQAAPERPSDAVWTILRDLVERAANVWARPDSGIWEVRGRPRDYLYGKLLCWVALDRGLEMADEHRLEAPRDRWRTVRAAIRDAILTRGYNQDRQAFTQSFGSSELDASALVIPRVGFLPPTDPRVRSTVAAIRRELTEHGLVYRYRAGDGLPGGEGTFALCTFWLVDALALGGRLDEAQALFEHTIAYANDVGLLSEELAPGSRDLLGNFPQGFSHLALIGSAVNLAKAADRGPEHAPENEADRAGRAADAAAHPRPSARHRFGGADAPIAASTTRDESTRLRDGDDGHGPVNDAS